MGVFRFILAISVLMAHSNPIFGFSFIGSELAVQAFYIISGFYMALILTEKYSRINNPYKTFITNRFLKIFPIYWTILALTLAYSLGGLIYSNGERFGFLNFYADYFNITSVGTLSILILANIFIFFQDAIMFLGLDTVSGDLFFTTNFHETKPMLYQFLLVNPAWSVAVELSFYLIAPILIHKKTSLLLALISLSLALRFYLIYLGLGEDPWSYRFFPTELLFFLLGIIAYRIYIRLQKIKLNMLYPKLIYGAMLTFTILFSFIPYQGKYYLAIFFLALPFMFLLTKNWKYDRYLGELSYPIYLSHLLILTIIHVSKMPVFGERGLVLLIFSVLFSILLHETIAKKMDRVRQKRVTVSDEKQG